MDWQISRIIKATNENGWWHSNIVGILKTDKTDYVYKVARLPSWRPFWELMVSESLKRHLPSVKHFSRIHNIEKINMDVDRNLATLPSSHSSHKDGRYVIISKIIKGTSLAERIRMGCNEELIVSVVFQVLCAVWMGQMYAGFTHYDLHGNNIILKKEKNPKIFNLYVTEDWKALVHSIETPVIIDYEYAHVSDSKGKRMDCRLDLVDKFYIPTRFDPR